MVVVVRGGAAAGGMVAVVAVVALVACRSLVAIVVVTWLATNKMNASQRIGIHHKAISLSCHQPMNGT